MVGPARSGLEIVNLVSQPPQSDREKSQIFIQRYMAHFPAAGEIILFDRSWYNRAGVEPVMGFCTPREHERFLSECPGFEKRLIEDEEKRQSDFTAGMEMKKSLRKTAPKKEKEEEGLLSKIFGGLFGK